MKNVLVAVIAVLVLTSCKKTFTCSCTEVATESGLSSYELHKAKKADAEKSCEDSEETYKVTSANAKCELK